MSRKLRISLIATVAVLAIGAAHVLASSLMSKTPAYLGLLDGQLTPCPDSPNCVSSQASDEDQRVEPLATGEGEELERAFESAVAALASLPRSEIVKREDRYAHGVVRSALFRFPDDVEIWLNRGEGRIEVRSAARLGYSDFGVNRKRAERLAEMLRGEERR